MSLDKNKVKELLIKNIDVKDIAIELKEKESTIRKCISRNFSETVEQIRKAREDEIAKLYEKGDTSEKIAYKLNMPIGTVENYFKIDRFIQLKPIHEENLKERKKIIRDTKRIMNQENNYILSTRNAVKLNSQSYKHKNGKLVFDDTRGAKPWDLPQIYAVNA